MCGSRQFGGKHGILEPRLEHVILVNYHFLMHSFKDKNCNNKSNIDIMSCFCPPGACGL